MTEGEVYDQVLKLVDEAFNDWARWSPQVRRYTAQMVHQATERIDDRDMKRKAMSKVYSHQRLYKEILKYLGMDVD